MKLISHGSPVLRTLMRLLAITVLVAAVGLSGAQPAAKPAAPADELLPGSPLLIQPQELVQSMKTGHEQPVVLYVGPKSFWVQAHIPGADYIGPVAKPEGIQNLRTRIAPVPKS